jgi:hypothetical protein
MAVAYMLAAGEFMERLAGMEAAHTGEDILGGAQAVLNHRAAATDGVHIGRRPML